MKPKYEKAKIKQGFHYIIGCDEVGRGCLAGPVVAAAVILDYRVLDTDYGINDSKVLTPKKREELSDLIKANALAWSIGSVSQEQVDEINIHNASLLAMKQAVEGLSLTDGKPLVAVDGKFVIPNFKLQQEAIIDGDAKVLSIAAASIVAKVYRDNLMKQLNEQYPEYEFARHKGYATSIHRTAIKKFGLTPLHRLSFCGQYL